jgi:hypothetical protein
VIHRDSALGQQFLHITVDKPYRRYQRTATVMTSGGNRKPAKVETEPDDVTSPVSRSPRSTNATVPSPVFRQPHAVHVDRQRRLLGLGAPDRELPD